MRMCEARGSEDRMYWKDKPGEFGKSGETDKEVMEALKMEKGSERRKGLIDVCRIRYTLARQKVEGLVACGAVDKDRVSKRLKSDLEEARDAGGGDRVWAVMRAVGRARADLVGKKMKPREGCRE